MAGKFEPNQRQMGIINLLAERSPKLAGIYRESIRMLSTPPEPGCESARVSVICHCMREVMNGIPSAIGDAASQRPDPSSQALATKLPGLLAANPDVRLDADQDLIPVNRTVASAFAQLVKTVQLEDGRNQRDLAGFLTGDPNNRHVASKQWNEARRFFLGWTHLDRNHTSGRELPSDTKILEYISVVEDIVEARTAAFFDTIRVIQELLVDINAEALAESES